MTGPNASNITNSSLDGPADRATVIRELGKLRQELRAAKAMDSPNREAIVRQKIDRRLEALYQCVDPRDTASIDEFGPLG